MNKRLSIMKTLLATITTVFLSLIAFPEKADARPHNVGHSYIYKSGTASCGCVTYTKRVIVSYNRYGRPVYRYYSQPITHSCGYRKHSYNGYYGNSYSAINYNRSRYNRNARYSSHSRRFSNNNRRGNIRNRRY